MIKLDLSYFQEEELTELCKALRGEGPTYLVNMDFSSPEYAELAKHALSQANDVLMDCFQSPIYGDASVLVPWMYVLAMEEMQHIRNRTTVSILSELVEDITLSSSL